MSGLGSDWRADAALRIWVAFAAAVRACGVGSSCSPADACDAAQLLASQTCEAFGHGETETKGEDVPDPRWEGDSTMRVVVRRCLRCGAVLG